MYKSLNCLDFSVPFVVLVLAVCFEYTGLDLRLSRHFYDPVLHDWPYKAHWLTQDLLHTGGRSLVIVMATLVLLLIVGSTLSQGLKPYRKDLAFVLVAGISGPAIIGMLKAMTHIYSPWDLHLFAGKLPYIRIFDHVPVNAAVGHAFPAAHASGGFAWFSIYFALRRRAVRRFQLSLLLPMILGLLFGFAQQARGAHFLSHDLVSLAICWMCSVLWARWLFVGKPTLPLTVPSSPALPTVASRN